MFDHYYDSSETIRRGVIYFQFNHDRYIPSLKMDQPQTGHDNTLTRAGQRADRFIPRKKHSSGPSAEKRAKNRKKRR